jgi:hypothetical protein
MRDSQRKPNAQSMNFFPRLCLAEFYQHNPSSDFAFFIRESVPVGDAQRKLMRNR